MVLVSKQHGLAIVAVHIAPGHVGPQIVCPAAAGCAERMAIHELKHRETVGLYKTRGVFVGFQRYRELIGVTGGRNEGERHRMGGRFEDVCIVLHTRRHALPLNSQARGLDGNGGIAHGVHQIRILHHLEGERNLHVRLLGNGYGKVQVLENLVEEIDETVRSFVEELVVNPYPGSTLVAVRYEPAGEGAPYVLLFVLGAGQTQVFLPGQSLNILESILSGIAVVLRNGDTGNHRQVVIGLGVIRRQRPILRFHHEFQREHGFHQAVRNAHIDGLGSILKGGDTLLPADYRHRLHGLHGNGDIAVKASVFVRTGDADALTAHRTARGRRRHGNLTPALHLVIGIIVLLRIVWIKERKIVYDIRSSVLRRQKFQAHRRR